MGPVSVANEGRFGAHGGHRNPNGAPALSIVEFGSAPVQKIHAIASRRDLSRGGHPSPDGGPSHIDGGQLFPYGGPSKHEGGIIFPMGAFVALHGGPNFSDGPVCIVAKRLRDPQRGPHFLDGPVRALQLAKRFKFRMYNICILCLVRLLDTPRIDAVY